MNLFQMIVATSLAGTFTLAAGCKSSKGGDAVAKTGGGSGTTEPKAPATATEPKAPATAACSSEHTKNAAGFCVKLLASFKPRPEKKLGDTTTYVYADDHNSVSIDVKPYKQNEYEVDLRSMNSSAEARKGTSSQLPNDGKYWLYTDADNEMIGVSVTRNGAVSIQCNTLISASSTDTDKDAVLAICKSVLPL